MIIFSKQKSLINVFSLSNPPCIQRPLFIHRKNFILLKYYEILVLEMFCLGEAQLLILFLPPPTLPGPLNTWQPN